MRTPVSTGEPTDREVHRRYAHRGVHYDGHLRDYNTTGALVLRLKGQDTQIRAHVDVLLLYGLPQGQHRSEDLSAPMAGYESPFVLADILT